MCYNGVKLMSPVRLLWTGWRVPFIRHHLDTSNTCALCLLVLLPSCCFVQNIFSFITYKLTVLRPEEEDTQGRSHGPSFSRGEILGTRFGGHQELNWVVRHGTEFQHLAPFYSISFCFVSFAIKLTNNVSTSTVACACAIVLQWNTEDVETFFVNFNSYFYAEIFNFILYNSYLIPYSFHLVLLRYFSFVLPNTTKDCFLFQIKVFLSIIPFSFCVCT